MCFLDYRNVSAIFECKPVSFLILQKWWSSGGAPVAYTTSQQKDRNPFLEDVNQHDNSAAQDFPLLSSMMMKEQPELSIDVRRPVYTQSRFDTDFQYEAPQNPTIRKHMARCCSELPCSSQGVKAAINRVLPFVDIMSKYNIKTDLVGDLVAGLTVGILSVPQSKITPCVAM